MALAIDGSTPAKVTGTAAGIVSPAFSPPANATIVAFVARNTGSAGGNADGTVTSTGGLTWALAGRKSVNAGSIGGAGTAGCTEIWIAQTTTAPGSITVTDTRTSGGSTAAGGHILKPVVITGAEATWAGAIAAAFAASGLPSVALTTTRANSWVFAVSSDWSAAGLGTVGSGQTMIDEDNTASQYSAHVWRQTAATPTSGTSVTSNLTAPSGQQYNVLAIEIREPAGGGTTQNATATLAVTASLTVDAPKTTLPATALAATATLAVAATDTISPATSVAATATLTAGATTSGAGATATLAATATLSATADRIAAPAASVAATATLTPAAVDTISAGATVAATATLTTAAARTAVAAVTLPATATLTAAATDTIPAGVSLPVTATLTPAVVTGAPPKLADTTLTATATLSTSTARTAISATSLAATATLTPGLSASRSATAAVAVIAALAPGATDLYQVGAVLAVTAVLVAAVSTSGALNPARGRPTLASATASVGLTTAGSTARLVPRSEMTLR